MRSDEISQQLLNHQRLIAPFPAEYAYPPAWIHALGLSLATTFLWQVGRYPSLVCPTSSRLRLRRNDLTVPTPGLCRAAEIRVQAGETRNEKREMSKHGSIGGYLQTCDFVTGAAEHEVCYARA
jgi:hypothetical protein